MANLLAISHVRRVDTLGVRTSILGDSKLTFTPFRPQVRRKPRLGTVAKASSTTGKPYTKRKDIEFEEWEKTPFRRFRDYVASLLPPGRHTKDLANAGLIVLCLFWLLGVPWLGSILPFIPWKYEHIYIAVGIIAYAAAIYNWLCAKAILKEYERQGY